MMVPELTPFGSNSLGQGRRSHSANASFNLVVAVPQATQSSEEQGLPMTLDPLSDGNRVSSRETATADGWERAQVGRSAMAPSPAARGTLDSGRLSPPAGPAPGSGH
jgi:hypothetical protein